MADKKLNFLLPFLLAVLLAVGMAVGFKLRESTWHKRPIREKAEFSRLEEIMSLIENKYVDTFDREIIVDKLVESLVSQLDPHSFYISATELSSVNESLEGNFEGIGIEFYVLNDTIIVVSPISGGPSEELGIMSGDKIILIDDTVIAGIGVTNNDVIKKLRGKKGTKVKVDIKRNGSKDLLSFTITRDKIPITSVDVGYMVDDETGYIKINRFSANTYQEFMEEMRKLNQAGMQQLVIDLRQNPGGYLNAATMMADELIGNDRLVVYTEGKAYKRKEYRANRQGIFENGNLAIIIDEGSASASEILAGAVQDWDRGIVTGRRSFGKGLVQEQYNLRDGSALRLTVARYYTPSGRSIQKPYNNGSDLYHSEITERYYQGEYLTPDSSAITDSAKFFTSKGKVVYAGGGIMPDVFVPIDTSVDLQNMAKVRSFIPEFVYDHFSANGEQYRSYESLKKFRDEFEVSDLLYKNFIVSAQSKGMDVKEEIFATFENQVRVLMKAHIARQIWKNEGFFSIANTVDRTYNRTLELLKE